VRIKKEYIQYGQKQKQNLESELEKSKILLESAKIKVAEREGIYHRSCSFIFY
jgi:hypothetical protein